MALSREEEELMMSDDITQSLHTSVDNWENLLSAAKQVCIQHYVYLHVVMSMCILYLVIYYNVSE